jgi:hypothetical protein
VQNADSLSTARASVQALIESIKADIGARRAVLADVDKQINQLKTDPLPLDEAAGRIVATVARIGEAWMKYHGHGLVDAAYGFALAQPRALPDGVPCVVPGCEKAADLLGMLCAGAPDVVTAALRGGVARALASRAPGPPLDRRAAQLEELSRRRAALVAEDEAAVDAAIADGFTTVAHLTETQERRQEEQRNANRMAALQREQDEIDRRARERRNLAVR